MSSLFSFLGPWGCCQGPSGGDFKEATMQATTKRSVSLSSGPSANLCCLPSDQVVLLAPQQAPADAADTEPSFSAPYRSIRTTTERKRSSPGPSTPRSGRSLANSAGVGIIFSIREESGELEVDSLVSTGPARPFSSTILRGDVLIEVDGIAIQNLEHMEIGRLIIGPAGSTAHLVFKRAVVNLQTGEMTNDSYAVHIVRQPNKRPAGPKPGFTYA